MGRNAGVSCVAMGEHLLPFQLGWPFIPGRSQPLMGPPAIWKLVVLTLSPQQKTNRPVFVDSTRLATALIAPFLVF